MPEYRYKAVGNARSGDFWGGDTTLSVLEGSSCILDGPSLVGKFDRGTKALVSEIGTELGDLPLGGESGGPESAQCLDLSSCEPNSSPPKSVANEEVRDLDPSVPQKEPVRSDQETTWKPLRL